MVCTSRNNSIYKNINGGVQGYSLDASNYLTDGTGSVGNYYSDYTGLDNNNDGIG